MVRVRRSPRPFLLFVTLAASIACGSTERETECPSGKTACDDVCVDLLTDISSCGACGHACGPRVGCFSATCTSPSPMPTPRGGMQAASLPDGRIVVIGGNSGTGGPMPFLGSVEIYNPRLNTWTKATPMPTARAYMGVAIRDGQVMVVGGQDDNVNIVPTTEGQVYDPSDDSWSSSPNLVEPRMDAPLVVTSDGRAWVIWGSNYDVPVQSIEVLEPAGTWALLPTATDPPRSAVRAFPAPDDQIYVLGGVGENFSIVFRNFLLFDLGSGTWTELAETRMGHGIGAAALGHDGRLYAIAGLEELDDAHDGVERYDPTTNEWSFVAPLPLPLVDCAAATGADGRIYVMGGTFGLGLAEPVDAMFVYDPELDQWFE